MKPKIKQKSLIIFSCIILMLSLFPLVYAQTGSWIIEPNFYFRGTDNGGDITFGSNTRMQGWYWSDNLVRFQEFNIDGYTYSELGFNCSPESNITLISAQENVIEYTVNGPTGNISITQVRLPINAELSHVEGADSYSLSDNIVTVYLTHSSPGHIMIYLAVSTSFNTLREAWGQLFIIIVFCAIVGLLNAPLVGDWGSPFLRTILSLVAGTAVLFIFLQVVENL